MAQYKKNFKKYYHLLQCHILDNDVLDSSMKALKNKVKDLIPDLCVW